MDAQRFWSIIDTARAAGEPVSTQLAGSLLRLPSEDILAFQAWFSAYRAQVNREDLWAAAYAIKGGCGDDGFDYFRAWLVTRGEAVVRAAIVDPESLAQLPSLGEDERMLYVASVAYQRAAKAELPPLPTVTVPGSEAWPPDRIERGRAWTKSFYAKLFPTLYAKYVESRTGWEESGEIDEARFWAILDAARANTQTIEEFASRLRALLADLATAEVLGFHRWVRSYEAALRREDVTAACRVLLGSRIAASGFVDWVIAQGRAAVHAAVHDIDALLEHAQHPPGEWCLWHLVRSTLGERDVNAGSEVDTIDTNTWAPDWQVGPHTVADLRAKLPRLTARCTDLQLYGENDQTPRSPVEREAIAQALVLGANTATSDHVRLDQLEQAHRLWPEGNVDTLLEQRGAAHARVGNFESARADLDALLARRAFAHTGRWVRSQVRLALGDRAGALADAREAALHVEAARAWLVTQVPTAATRVRHPKFGDGTVVSTDTTGGEPTFVVDFEIGRKKIATRFLEAIA